jgi:hypothetical protein
MMHGGESVNYHRAIVRHHGEASKVRERYEVSPRRRNGETTIEGIPEFSVEKMDLPISVLTPNTIRESEAVISNGFDLCPRVGRSQLD